MVIDEIREQTGEKEDDILEWEVIRFLNKLSYLKEKNFVINQKLERGTKQ